MRGGFLWAREVACEDTTPCPGCRVAGSGVLPGRGLPVCRGALPGTAGLPRVLPGRCRVVAGLGCRVAGAGPGLKPHLEVAYLDSIGRVSRGARGTAAPTSDMAHAV